VRAAQAILLGAVWWLGGRGAQTAELRTLQSQSGQFTVRGLPLDLPPRPSVGLGEVSFVRLDPAVLAVSCERIKQALLKVLNLEDRWHDRVVLTLHPIQQDREPIMVRATGFSDGWIYQADLPEQVDRARLLQVTVQVLLLEIGNRRAHGKSVELPPWLSYGLAAHLAAKAGPTLALEPESRVIRHETLKDPLWSARQVLRDHAPLTLNELNWPTAEQWTDPHIEVYRSCAHVFVQELLHLKHGRESLQEMLILLPEYLNWQTAFLGSFREHFSGLADVDRWWALQVVRLTGRDLFSVWSAEETRRQLDQILSAQVEIRLQTNELPAVSQARLQTILTEWEPDRQRLVLLQKISQLQALQLRASKEWAGLVGDYVRTLDNFLQARAKWQKGGNVWNSLSFSPKVARQQAVRQLDDLDLRRLRLRQQSQGLNAAVESALAESYRRQPTTSGPTQMRPGDRP
jgi:hypothetical protein